MCAVVLAVGGLASCDVADTPDGTAVGAKSAAGDPTGIAAPPGRYRKLPEPCGALDLDSLKQFVPNAQDYAGEASLTYDADRLVGCSWSGRTVQGNRDLRISLERVVSYDPAVSDEAEATSQYDAAATAAGIPASAVTGAPPAVTSVVPPAGGPSTPSSTGAGATGPTPAGTVSPSAGLPSRRLADLGDDAFLDDELQTRDTGVHRDVTIVVRAANVLVTVSYSQWSTDKGVRPQSADLQRNAIWMARDLLKVVDR